MSKRKVELRAEAVERVDVFCLRAARVYAAKVLSRVRGWGLWNTPRGVVGFLVMARGAGGRLTCRVARVEGGVQELELSGRELREALAVELELGFRREA